MLRINGLLATADEAGPADHRWAFKPGCFARTRTDRTGLRIGHKGHPVRLSGKVQTSVSSDGLRWSAIINDPAAERRLRSTKINGCSAGILRADRDIRFVSESRHPYSQVTKVRRLDHIAIAVDETVPSIAANHCRIEGSKVRAGSSPAQYTLSGEISSETSRAVASFLSKHRDRDVKFTIDSPGGELFSGVAIYGHVSRHKGRTTAVVKQAGSASALLLMGFDDRQMQPNGKVIVHRVMATSVGNKSAMDDLRRILTTLDGTMAETFVARTGLSMATVEDLLEGDDGEGTTMNAQEAVRLGFADSVLPGNRTKRPAAFRTPSMYAPAAARMFYARTCHGIR